MVPKQTEPMVKFIRTGEGILVFGFNIALVVVPIVSNALTAAQSAKWAAILDGIAVISRTGLKMVASAQAKPPAAAAAAALEVAATTGYSLAGAGPPAVSGTPAAAAEPTGDGVLSQVAGAAAPDISAIAQLVADAEEFSDPPPAAESRSTRPPYSMSPIGNGQAELPLAGADSTADVPFLIRLGG
jgi:hypothetical protein